MSEMSGTVTQWLKPNQPLALWWQRNYPGLRQVSRDLAARLRAVRTSDLVSDSKELASLPLPLPYHPCGYARAALLRLWPAGRCHRLSNAHGVHPEVGRRSRAKRLYSCLGRQEGLAGPCRRRTAGRLRSGTGRGQPPQSPCDTPGRVTPGTRRACWKSEPPAWTNWLPGTGRDLTPLHSAKNPGSRTTASCWRS